MPGHGTSARILIFLAALGCMRSPRAAEDFSTWAHSATLRLNTTSSGANIRKTMTGTPLLVRITDTRILSQSQSDGSDLRFASETGEPLDFQIDRWNPALGKGEAWVRLPRIDSSSDRQSLKVYWGKPGAAWLSDGKKVFSRSMGYYAVYHMGEGGMQNRTNAVGNWNHAVPIAYEGDERVEGLIGMADSLDGAGIGGDYLDLGKGFDTLSAFTFHVWAYISKAGTGEKILDIGNGYGGDELAFGRPSQGDSLSGLFYGGTLYRASIGAAGALATGKWSLLGITTSGRTVTIYKDGTAIASGNLAQTMPNVSRWYNYLGQSGDIAGGGGSWDEGFGDVPYDGTFCGKLDEPQLSFVGHSAEWMKFAYESQRPDTKLYTWEFPPETRLEITEQPTGTMVAEGHSFSLSVTATGVAAIGYQWLKDGSPLAGANGPIYQVAAATLEDAGIYACRVTDGKDTAISKAAAVGVPEDYATWAHQRKIVLDPKSAGAPLSADVANIPILLHLGKQNPAFAGAADGGRDLRFADAEGSPLPYAIERWTSDTAEVWVRVGKVPAAGAHAFVTLYWGKSAARAASSPAAVFSINDNWRAYYAFSDSMGGSGSKPAKDATLNGYDAAADGAAGVADAPIGRGFAFAGSTASHLLAPAAATEGLQAFTILAWVREKTTGAGGAAPIQDPQIFGTGPAASGGKQFGVASKNGVLEAWVAGASTPAYVSQSGATHLNDGSWHLLAVTAAGTDFSVYADGTPAFSLAAPDLPLAPNGLGLAGVRAADGSWSAPFNGDIDAPQILGEAKSADWIRLAYAAQRPASALAVFQEAADPAPPAVVIDPAGGDFDAAVTVGLSCAADSVSIFYTLDGTVPGTTTGGSTRIYGSPIRLSSDGEVRALAYRDGQAGPVARAVFRIAGLSSAGDTLRSGGSSPVDGLRRIDYPRQDAQSPVLVQSGPGWNAKPTGFDRVGPLFQVSPLDPAAPFPGLIVTGDSLDGVSLYRRDPNSAILWMPRKDGEPLIPSAGTYFLGRDTLPPRLRLIKSEAKGNDSVTIRFMVSDNVAATQTKVRFGRSAPDSLSWWSAASGDTLRVSVPVPADASQPLEVNFHATDQSRESSLPPEGWITLPRPLPSLAAPIGLQAGIKWKMAGMPLAPGLSLSLKELAERSGTGPLYAAVWRGDTPPDSGYVVLSGDDTLPGGKGFWIAGDGNAPTLNFPPGRALASDSNGWFPIRLHKGWNLVACPSLRPLAWPVSIRDGEAWLRSPLKPLFAHSDTGYARPDSLRPWESYYVHYTKDTLLYLGSGAPRVSAGPPAKAAAGKSLSLALASADVRLHLGASSAARAGLGIEDEALPPPLKSPGPAWLSRQGRALAVDYVAWTPDSAMSWSVSLRSRPAGSALAVSAAALPPGYEAWAVSPSRRLKWPLETGSNIPVIGDDTLMIYAGTPAALARLPDLQRGRIAAGAFAVLFRPLAGGLELALDLPGEAHVAARILNARGEILGGFPNRALSPGRHAFAWPALARTSYPLPQGLYWLELRASGQGWNRRQVLSAGILR
jgi:hypothetical protein